MTDFVEVLSDFGSDALEVLRQNEWAANALAGAAQAGLGYLARRDEIRAKERAADRDREHQMYMASAGDIDLAGYGNNYSTLTNGALTDAGLIRQSQKQP